MARTATVGGGAKWAAVLNPAQEHGLAPLLGSTTDVGAVGYTLGGGMGWLARRYRLAGAVYLNFLDGEDRAARAAKAFSEENLTRLRRVKAALDPGNRYCHGFGIA